VARHGCVELKKRSPHAFGGNMHFQRYGWLMLLLVFADAAPSQNLASVQLVGVGSTAPAPIYVNWFRSYEKTHARVHFTYMPFGSEAGIQMATAATADFGTTEAPLTGQQLARAKVSQYATLVLAFVPVYNIAGAPQSLRFSPEALAGIYLGNITKWNDAAIANANPEIRLPSATIVVIHSADGRGSTYVFSDYLSKVSVEWRTRIGRGISIQWPAGVAVVANGNVAKFVEQTPNSIGYVELRYALGSGLPYGQVQNAAGNFITAEAASGAKTLANNFRTSITNSPGDQSYPISSFSWILVPKNMEPTKQEMMKDFLRFMLGEGQSSAVANGYTPLPGAIAESELDAIDNPK
jgi:phosphate transport system substrate-binding protein